MFGFVAASAPTTSGATAAAAAAVVTSPLHLSNHWRANFSPSSSHQVFPFL